MSTRRLTLLSVVAVVLASSSTNAQDSTVIVTYPSILSEHTKGDNIIFEVKFKAATPYGLLKASSFEVHLADSNGIPIIFPLWTQYLDSSTNRFVFSNNGQNLSHYPNETGSFTLVFQCTYERAIGETTTVYEYVTLNVVN